MYLNLTAVGNLGNDPEMRYLPDGTAVANFSMAVNKKWTTRDGSPMQETTWLRVSVWGAAGESVHQYLSKGSLVLVTGTLKPDPDTGGPRIWQRQDGSSGATYEVNAQSVRFLNTGQNNAAEESDVGQDDDDDDFAF